ncbi:caskin-1-like isoform X2 [Tigriopus californicus]|uniref:caskin-1-like isoform X2 n=1 Tax=Tigriopus californicus TaxID=6832 RepID=UPI0027DA6F94|nr:caskin-1-like isoform X2 [Tigriopus californicus]
MRKIKSVGGMNKTNRVSTVAKPVVPPTVPGSSHEPQQPSRCLSSFKPTWAEVDNGPLHQNPGNSVRHSSIELQTGSSFRNLTDDQGIDMTLSPGRDSIGHDSTASYVTTGSSVSSGCRNSTTSIDSGRESNSIMSTFSSQTGHRMHPHQRHAALSSGPKPGCHSSSSSLGSIDRGEDSICTLNVHELVENGMQDREILNIWLSDLNFEDYFDLFDSAGYDMPTISRMTPEDLTAIGIKKPNHRKKLKSEISKLNIGDGLPNHIPASLDEWLRLIRLSSYGAQLHSQGYHTVTDVLQICVEDLEDVGIYKLGHQKRFLLAVKKIKEIRSGKRAMIGTSECTLPPKGMMSPRPKIPSADHYNYDLRKAPEFRPDMALSGRTSSFGGNPIYQPEIIQINSSQHQGNLPMAPVSPLRGLTHSMNSRHTYASDQHSTYAHPPQQQFFYESDHPGAQGASLTSGPSSRDQHQQQQQQQQQQPEQPHPSQNSFGRPPLPSPPLSERQNPDDFGPSISSAFPPRMPHLRFTSIPHQPVYDSLGYHQASLSNSTGLPSWSHGKTMDDVDAIRHQKQSHFQYQARALLSSQDLGSGGTLPRPKGLVKPIPVAKIMANSREQEKRIDDDHMAKFEPLKLPDPGSDSSLDPLPSLEQIPFANEHAGTIRPREISTSEFINQDEEDENADLKKSLCEDNTKGKSKTKLNRSPGQRSAGDVLNDIGSMLADLTDELDAMLHSERDAPDSSSPSS